MKVEDEIKTPDSFDNMPRDQRAYVLWAGMIREEYDARAVVVLTMGGEAGDGLGADITADHDWPTSRVALRKVISALRRAANSLEQGLDDGDAPGLDENHRMQVIMGDGPKPPGDLDS